MRNSFDLITRMRRAYRDGQREARSRGWSDGCAEGDGYGTPGCPYLAPWRRRAWHGARLEGLAVMGERPAPSKGLLAAILPVPRP